MNETKTAVFGVHFTKPPAKGTICVLGAKDATGRWLGGVIVPTGVRSFCARATLIMGPGQKALPTLWFQNAVAAKRTCEFDSFYMQPDWVQEENIA